MILVTLLENVSKHKMLHPCFPIDILVSSPGRDSHDICSARLAEATQKPLGTNAP